MEIEEQILSDVKMLLGIEDDTKDAVINYHIRSVIRKVKNYCHREDLPDALIEVITEMVVRQYVAWLAAEAEAEAGGGGTESGGVSGIIGSISRGDISISYDNSSEAVEAAAEAAAVKASAWKLPTDDILLDYRAQLNAYRKVHLI